jgi:hypothetical protein
MQFDFGIGATDIGSMLRKVFMPLIGMSDLLSYVFVAENECRAFAWRQTKPLSLYRQRLV